jgi:MFS family permease
MLFWTGEALSGLGSQISLVAYPLLVLALTGSPAKAGIVGFARNVPIAVLALPAGVLADRVDRRYLLVACDAISALALASIPVAIVAGGVPYGLIVVVALVDGSGFVLSWVTERGVLRQLVVPEQLGEAVARNESRIFGAMLAGPPLGGLLFGIGRAIPFLGDAVSYGASTATKLLISAPFQQRRTVEPVGSAREGRDASGPRRPWSPSPPGGSAPSSRAFCSKAPALPPPCSRSRAGRCCWPSPPPRHASSAARPG